MSNMNGQLNNIINIFSEQMFNVKNKNQLLTKSISNVITLHDSKNVDVYDTIASILKLITLAADLTENDYAITNDYVHNENVMNVIVSKSGFIKLEKMKCVKTDATILDDNICLRDDEIDVIPKLYFQFDIFMIQFFERENIGIPIGDFSLKNLQKKSFLTFDSYNNPTLNIQAYLKLYGSIYVENGKLYTDNGETNTKKLDHNLANLRTLKKHYAFSDIFKKINTEIKNIKQIKNRLKS